MTTRILVGLVAAPIVLIPLWLGGVWALLLILAVALIGGVEFYELMAHGGYAPARVLGLLWLAALVVTGWHPGMPWSLAVLTGGLILTLIYALYQTESPVTIWAVTSIGAIYLGLMPILWG
jgi:CDP-diglyceride synthetase